MTDPAVLMFLRIIRQALAITFGVLVVLGFTEYGWAVVPWAVATVGFSLACVVTEAAIETLQEPHA